MTDAARIKRLEEENRDLQRRVVSLELMAREHGSIPADRDFELTMLARKVAGGDRAALHAYNKKRRAELNALGG